MAARNPTTFVTYCEELLLAPLMRILASEADDHIAQQLFALDKEELIVSDCWPALTTTSAAFVTVGKFEARVKDYAGSPTYAASWAWTPLVWAGAGVTSFEVRLQDIDNGSSSTLVVSTLLTSQIWRAFSTLTPRFANDADSLELSIRVAGGAGSVYIAGLGVFAP